MSNYATNADLNGVTGDDACNLASKPNLALLKTEVDKIDIAKLKTVPADLSRLSNNKVVKQKRVCDKLAAKITQNYLVLKMMYRYLKKTGDTDHISAWKSKELSDESIRLPTTSNNNFAPSLNIFGVRARVKLDGSCLKQDKITFTHKAVVSIYIVYEINL